MLTSTPSTRFAPTTGITDAPPSPPRTGDESGVDALLLPPLLLNGDEPLDIGGDARESAEEAVRKKTRTA